MNSILAAIETRLTRIDIQLEGLIADGDAKSIVALEDEGDTLRRIRSRLQPPPRRWKGPLAVAAAAMLIVSVGSLIRLTPTIGIDATASEVHFTTAAQGTVALARPLNLESLDIVGVPVPPLGGPVTLEALTMRPGTNATLSVAPNGCYSILTIPGLGGVDIRRKAANDAGVANPLEVAPGGQVAFCAKDSTNILLSGSVGTLSMMSIARYGTPNITLSSIHKGSLTISDSGRTLPLDAQSRVALSDISGGWMNLYPGKDLHLVFAGRAKSVIRKGVADTSRDDLRPTLVDWASGSPKLTAIIAAISGLIGLIWSVGRYFGF